MRFLRPLLSLCLLTVSRTSGHTTTLGLPKRALDLCANVNADVGLLSIVGVELDLCLCISGIPALISTNPQLQLAAQLQGTPAVTAALTALVRFPFSSSFFFASPNYTPFLILFLIFFKKKPISSTTVTYTDQCCR